MQGYDDVLNGFCVFGISHNEFGTSVRECFSIADEQLPHIYSELQEIGCSDILVLSTCNRVEVYCTAPDSEKAIDVYLNCVSGEPEAFKSNCYLKRDTEAALHLLEVSAGIHSQIQGDFEIIGQIRKAFKVAKNFQGKTQFIERLVNCAVKMSKQIKNQTQFSSGVTSTAYAAVHKAKSYCSDSLESKILIFGLGKIGSNVCENLIKHFPKRNLCLVNRTIENGVTVANKYGIEISPIESISEKIALSDVLIVATSAPQPTVVKELIPTNKEMLIIDLSMPRNVSIEIDQMSNITVCDVDEISKENLETMEQRSKELPKVEAIVQAEMDEFVEWMKSRKYSKTIKAIKDRFIDLQEKELQKMKSLSREELDARSSAAEKIINGITGQIFSGLQNLDESELTTVHRLFNINH